VTRGYTMYQCGVLWYGNTAIALVVSFFFAMPPLLGWTCLCVLLSVAISARDDARGYGARGLVALSRLNQCVYDDVQGTWAGEGLWQSGNTLETLANLAIATGNASLFAGLMKNSYDREFPQSPCGRPATK
jgi:hypothetical protein